MPRFQFALSWRLALRHFVKSPGSYLYGAVTLALGLGSATLLFSLVQGLTAPLPVPNGEHVLRVVVVDPVRSHAHVTTDDFRAWRTHAGSFESIAAVAVAERRVDIKRGDFPARVAHTTTEVFPLLGVEPLLGRWPTEADGTTIAVGENLWTTTFEGDPAILGREVRLDDEVAVVVGVMPSGFRFPYKQDIWQVVAEDSPRLANGEVVSRLKPGVSRAAASGEFTELMQAARTDREGIPATSTARLIGFTEERGDRAEYAVGIALLLVVLELVLLSCSNVSALLLERNLARTRTLALHQALGARPAQIALQILVEALLVGGLGGILGAAVAHAGLRFLTTTLADNLNFYWTRLELDVASVGFAGGLSVVVAVLCGALPAWRAVRTDVGRTLAEQAEAVKGSRRTPVSWILVNAQMAFAVAVVVAAVGLAAIVVQKPWEIDLAPEFSGDRVVAAQIAFEAAAVDAPRVEVLLRLQERVRALPGVQPATVSVGDWRASRVRRFGLHRVAFGDEPFGDDRGVPILYITPGFIDTFAISLVEGRPFDARDMGSDAGAADVAIVTEEFVRERLPDQASLGRHIRVDQGGGRERAFRIVGVVSNLAVTEDHRRSPVEHVLLPVAATQARTFQLTTRTAGLPGIDAEVERIVRDTAPGVATVAYSFAESMRQLNDYLGRITETLGVLAILGGGGCLLVVAIGIYGLVAFEVRQRRGEYAVRLALGARAERLLWLVVRRVGLLVVPGTVLGFVFAGVGSPLMRAVGGQDIDVVPVFVAVFALYAVVVAVAAGVPTLRVVRANPARVLNG